MITRTELDSATAQAQNCVRAIKAAMHVADSEHIANCDNSRLNFGHMTPQAIAQWETLRDRDLATAIKWIANCQDALREVMLDAGRALTVDIKAAIDQGRTAHGMPDQIIVVVPGDSVGGPFGSFHELAVAGVDIFLSMAFHDPPVSTFCLTSRHFGENVAEPVELL